MNRIKKIAIAIGSALGLSAPLLTLGADPTPAPFIELGDDFVPSMLAWSGQVLTDTKMLILIAMAIPVGFWIALKVIGLVRGRAKA